MFESVVGAASAGMKDYLYGHTPPDDPRIQAMSAEQMAEYQRQQGDPTNVPMSAGALAGMQNAWRQPVRKPTMTLSEWDARRAAFKPQTAPRP